MRGVALAALVVLATGCAVGDPAGAPASSAPSSASPTASTSTSTSAKPSPVRTTATNPKLRAELLTMLAADHKDWLVYLAELAKICAPPQ